MSPSSPEYEGPATFLQGVAQKRLPTCLEWQGRLSLQRWKDRAFLCWLRGRSEPFSAPQFYFPTSRCAMQIPLGKPAMLLWMLVITFAAAIKGRDTIEMVASGPKEGRVSGSLPLTCTVTGAPLDSRWYDWNSVRQAPGGQLQFLAWIYPYGKNTGYGPTFRDRVTISADKDKGKVSLQLRALTASDTATYFCARHRGLGQLGVATDKIVFGTGITFSVEPKIQEESVPEVVALKSKGPKRYDNKLNVACLARAFYPKNISLDVPMSDTVYDLKAPLLTSEGIYSTMKVAGVESDAKVTCKVTHKGNKTTTSIILPEEKTEEFGTVNACKITDASTKDVKMERMNMLFMAVLGLRVLLVKSITLNIIMSITLFLF
ncbi:PREDICTED: Ig heavy chain Mem5-like [Calidris pugnax]|uniref:Ig heavy chain Mem5-like n=1 Tax=Calidris pugnax TaxID=198806 RepID=UPI00071DBB44|nr:PREDICTED: Ig heavy chain Mem5-like [Calidris pugnax]